MNSLVSRQPAWVNRSVVPPWPAGRRVKVIRVSIHASGPSATRHTPVVRGIGQDLDDGGWQLGLAKVHAEAAADGVLAANRTPGQPARDAVRAGDEFVHPLPDEGEVLALLALMSLHDARRAARLRGAQIVPLDDQDRALWDEQQIDEGRALLQRAMTRGRTGPYLVQAAIADLHLHNPRDWRQIAALYESLVRQTRSPIVELNRAIAVAEIDGIQAGLEILDRLDLDHYRYFHSTRAEFLRRAGRDGEAHRAYLRALDLAQTEPERRFLADRLAETTISAPTTEPGCANP